MAAVIDAIDRQVELEVVLQIAPAARRKGGVSAAEGTCRFKVAELLDRRPRGRIHRSRIEGHIGRHAGTGAIGARDAGVQRPEVGPARGFADNRLDVVIAVPGLERADNRRRMGQRGQTGKRRAIGDAGK